MAMFKFANCSSFCPGVSSEAAEVSELLLLLSQEGMDLTVVHWPGDGDWERDPRQVAKWYHSLSIIMTFTCYALLSAIIVVQSSWYSLTYTWWFFRTVYWKELLCDRFCAFRISAHYFLDGGLIIKQWTLHVFDTHVLAHFLPSPMLMLALESCGQIVIEYQLTWLARNPKQLNQWNFWLQPDYPLL